MDLAPHTITDLFEQLGLPSAPADIDRFVVTHQPLRADVRLADADFWSPSQAKFLRDELAEDADWAEVVDALNLMLRAPTSAH